MTRSLPAPLSWLAGLLIVYLVAPFLAGIPQVFAAHWQSVDTVALGHACAVSVASATLASFVIALGGIPLGLLLARVSNRFVATVGFLVQLPLALPPLASGVFLLFLLGRRSPLGRLTGAGLTDSFAGIVLAEVFVAAPFLIIAARSAFAAIDPMIEGVAATLGARPAAIFFEVSLPLAWPMLRAGLLLSWLRAFGEFGATVMVAYHPYSLPVYTYVAFGSEGLPTMLPVVLPALAAAVLFMLLAGRLGTGGRKRQRAQDDLGSLASGGASANAGPIIPAHPCAESTRTVDVDLKFHRHLEGFRLEVAWATRARRLAVLGPSGAGKSLLLRMIAGLERPDAGHLRVAGRELSRLPPEDRRVAYVPQNYCLFPHFTLAQQLRFPVGVDRAAAAHWMGRLGLADLADRFPAELSLGQQQRAALARALVRPADLMLLDEPFSALDAPLRSRLRREFRSLQEEWNLCTILVTHDPAEAALLADEVLVISEGSVLQADRFALVVARPASELVARLLGAEQVNAGTVVAEDQIDIGAGVPLRVGGPALRCGERVGWSVRAGRVRWDGAGPYEGRIESVLAVGEEWELLVRIGEARLRIVAGGGELEHSGGGDASGPRAPGDLGRFDIDPNAVQVWPV